MTDKVSFTAMEHGTQADYDLIAEYDDSYGLALADRVLSSLRSMEGESPYQISRLAHCLQAATRAERDGADDETVLCALLHDIGDVLSPHNHSEVAAAVLKPFVSEKNHWIVKHHGVFQGYYFFHFFGGDRNVRDRYRDHPYAEACKAFCADWDQTSFDPVYDTLPLQHFEERLRALFAKPPVVPE